MDSLHISTLKSQMINVFHIATVTTQSNDEAIPLERYDMCRAGVRSRRHLPLGSRCHDFGRCYHLLLRNAVSGIEQMIIVALIYCVHLLDLANPRLKSTRQDLSRLQELEATWEEWKQTSCHSAL